MYKFDLVRFGFKKWTNSYSFLSMQLWLLLIPWNCLEIVNFLCGFSVSSHMKQDLWPELNTCRRRRTTWEYGNRVQKSAGQRPQMHKWHYGPDFAASSITFKWDNFAKRGQNSYLRPTLLVPFSWLVHPKNLPTCILWHICQMMITDRCTEDHRVTLQEWRVSLLGTFKSSELH